MKVGKQDREGTFAGASGNDADAPKTVLGRVRTLKSSSSKETTSVK
jgi:hypothetical protein